MKYFRFFLVLAILQISSASFASNIKTSPYPEQQVSGSEKWVIDENSYLIDGTMIVRVSTNPNYLYAIRMMIDEDPGSQHELIAKAVAKYAFKHGYFDKAKGFKYNNNPIKLMPKIGVAVIRQANNLFVKHNTGYRFQFELNDIK